MFKKIVILVVVLTLLWLAISVVLSQPNDDQSKFVSDHAYSVSGKISAGNYYYENGQLKEEMVPGATIFFFQLGNPDPVATTITDGDGEFEINELWVADPYGLISPYRAGYNFGYVYQGTGPLTLSSGYHQTSIYYSYLNGHPSTQYKVSVFVVTPDAMNINGATITFRGPSIGTKVATTQEATEGDVIDKHGGESILTFTPEVERPTGQYGVMLSGPVNITASKPGWTFAPSSIFVEGSRLVMFVGTPIEQSSETIGGPAVRNQQRYEAVFVPDGITWDDAKAAAEARNGYLATIDGPAENQFVFSLIEDDKFWIWDGLNGEGPLLGGYQVQGSPEPDGGWVWVKGSMPFSYANWGEGEPNDFKGYEDVLAFFGKGTTKSEEWNDVSREYKSKGYIIEWDSG